MTTKIFLIEHENSFLGYQAFKEVSGKMQFICDLEFLDPLEIFETQDEENETLTFNYHFPLINALEHSSIDFQMENNYTFIISEGDLDKLLKHIYDSRFQKLQKTSEEYRKKAEVYTNKALECEREALGMAF